ncbi:hypothetical protein RJ640_018468 [Escallonia rubra]|uniref:Uncharacterized protein n=1 Tax=Escallonia rubra TaxID=112253 RepID=A0AA88QJB9_9ASTE|nr:hypothetical protein RJ640_018468 [Escallonia rubra]
MPHNAGTPSSPTTLSLSSTASPPPPLKNPLRRRCHPPNRQYSDPSSPPPPLTHHPSLASSPTASRLLTQNSYLDPSLTPRPPTTSRSQLISHGYLHGEVDPAVGSENLWPRSTRSSCLHCFSLPLQGIPPHHLALLTLHQLPHQHLHLISLHIVINLHPYPPLHAAIPAIRLLLGEKRPTDHRYAAAYTLNTRIPPTVRQKTSHRRVPQNLLLRAPTSPHAPPFRLGHKLRRDHRGFTGDNIRPNYPQEVFLAVSESPCKLGELLGCHDSYTAKVHRRKTFFNETAILRIGQEATGACSPEKHFRYTKLFSGCQRKAHHPVGNYARHRRYTGKRTVVELRDEVTERGQGVLGRVFTDGRYVLGGVGIRGREAVGDGLEAKVRQAVEGGGAPRPEQAAVVEVCVDKGDVKALVVEQLC